MPLFSRSRSLAFAPLLAVGTVGFGLWWFCVVRPQTRFLDSRGPATWIVYPTPHDLMEHETVEQVARFRRDFQVTMPPATARLHVRGMERFELALNGDVLSSLADEVANWKQPAQYDVSAHLKPGQNQFTVRVANRHGPPALWLWLTADDLSLTTDSRWETSLEGSLWQAACPAAAPRVLDPAAVYGQTEITGAAFVSRLATLLLFAVLACGTVLAMRRLAVHRRAPAWAMLPVAVAWLVLAGNNLGALPYALGFDHTAHLDYIRCLLNNGRLPLASEGTEMFQPPLFYALTAGAARLLGVSASGVGIVVLLRTLSLTFALAQIAFVFASLRLVFPGQPRPQAVGLVLASFLPVNLYLAHYATNDLLAGTLAALSVYLALRVLRAPKPGPLLSLGLGIALGAAVLSKLTALPVALVIIAVLVGRQVAPPRGTPGGWLRTVGVTALACAAVSGWHFGRAWYYFGTFFIASYQPASGYDWWQEPGYNTFPYLFRFGQALVRPFFSEFHSLPDGLYSTLWGDGLWGGAATFSFRPPWNYDLMAIGYLLALLPTAAALVGFVAAVVQLVRQPRAEGVLLVGIACVMASAVLYHSLEVPYSCTVKAFYALPALTPFCVFAARGFELLAGHGRVREVLLGTGLGVWALMAYVSYWVVSGAPATLTWSGRQLALNGRYEAAVDCYQQALQTSPHDSDARLALGELLARVGRQPEAARQFAQVVADRPQAAVGHYYLALVRNGEKRPDAAIEEARRALELAPDYADAATLLGYLLRQQGRAEEAIEAYRRTLGLRPSDAQAHSGLAPLLTKQGQAEEAVEHYRKAIRLQPNAPETLAELARLYATHPNARFRNGPEAVRLAERACALTGRQLPAYLDTLAAAYAETGQFAQAVQTQEEAVKQAAASSQGELSAALQQRLALYRAKQPYRE